MSKTRSKFTKAVQSLPPSLMPAIAIIPIGGLMLGLGAFLTNSVIVGALPFLASPFMTAISGLLFNIGNLILGNFPIMFAISTASVYSKHDGAAALSAAVSYLVMNQSISTILGVNADMIALEPAKYTTILGIPTLSTGVFGGIICGILVAQIYKRFKDTELPTAFSFFQGKRLVAIISILCAAVLGAVLCVVWPPIQTGIDFVVNLLINTNSAWGIAVLVLLAAALMPFGLHTFVYVAVVYMFGSYVTSAGDTVQGAFAVFMAKLADGVTPDFSAIYLTNIHMNILILCTAALAIISAAEKQYRKKTVGMFSGGFVTVLLTGISEPMFYPYVFSCFKLYMLGSAMNLIGVMIYGAASFYIGTPWAGGLLDFLVYGVFQGSATGWFKIFWIAPLMCIPYFFLARFCIKKFHWNVPGQAIYEEDFVAGGAETTSVLESSAKSADGKADNDELVQKIIEGLGGADNIEMIDACATRLRVTVKDAKGISKDYFKRIGAKGTLVMDNNLQIVFGGQAAVLASKIHTIIDK